MIYRPDLVSVTMTVKEENTEFVRSGFSAQQVVLIAVAFLLGAASATVFNELIVERGFGPTSVVAAHVSDESK